MTSSAIPLVLVLLCLPAPAFARVSVRILGTDPTPPASLGHWEPFHLRVGYETDRPMRVRADAFFRGERVTSITSPSPRQEPGAGEAYFWLAYSEPARVDRIVVRAEDERTGQPLAESELAVDLTFTGQKPAQARTPAEWAQRMQADADRRVQAEFDAYANRPTPAWQTLLFFAATWSVPGYWIVQALLLWRLRGHGRWQLAAALPLLPMTGFLLHAVVAFFAGSNLFPLFLIFASLPFLLYLAALWLLWRTRGGGGAPALHTSQLAVRS
jgi:hypothetical protein